MLKLDGYLASNADGEEIIIPLTIDNRIGNHIRKLMEERDAIVRDETLLALYNQTLEDLGIPTGTQVDEVFLLP